MDAAGILRLVRGHLQRLGGEWALAGGFALQAIGFSRLTSPRFSNRLHPDPDLGRVDLIWLEGETSARFFAGCRDVADLQFLLALPGLDDNEVRGYFEKRGLSGLLERLKPRRFRLD